MSNPINHLDLWAIRDRYSLREAAILWAGINPHELEIDHGRYKVVEDELRYAVETGILKANAVYIPGFFEHELAGPQPCQFINEEKTMIAKEDLARWAMKKRRSPEFLQEEIAYIENIDATALAKEGDRTPSKANPEENKGGHPSAPEKAHKKTAQRQMPEGLLTVDEAARKLGISPNTLYTWRSTKRYIIPHIKVGSRVMYKEEDLEAYLAENRHDDR